MIAFAHFVRAWSESPLIGLVTGDQSPESGIPGLASTSPFKGFFASGLRAPPASRTSTTSAGDRPESRVSPESRRTWRRQSVQGVESAGSNLAPASKLVKAQPPRDGMGAPFTSKQTLNTPYTSTLPPYPNREVHG